MYNKVMKYLLVVLISLFACSTLMAEENKRGIERIIVGLEEFGWRVLHYECEEEEVWGNRGIGIGGYIVGGPRIEEEVVQPKILTEEELKALRQEISELLRTADLKVGERRELEGHLVKIESQLEAYKEKFEFVGGVTYTVKRGDSLWSIAKYHYGDAHKWPIIYRANKERIRNPNIIHPGQRLLIPEIRVRK